MINADLLEKLSPITEEEQNFLNGVKSIDKAIYTLDGGSIISNRKLIKDGESITIRPHTRFVHFPPHSHDYVEMVYMCQGSTTHKINGRSVILSEGDILILNQHSTHEILPASEKDIAVNFIILPKFFDNPLIMLGEEETPLRRFVIDCIAGRKSEEDYLFFSCRGLLPVKNLVENLIWTLLNKTPSRRKTTEFTMGLLLLQLIGNSNNLYGSSAKNSIVLKALRYIEDNYCTASLQELARLLSCDMCWLSREIKSKTGKTYTELVKEKRLSQSAFLLTNTALNVSEVAYRVGFSNLSYFHRIFEERFGMSPKKYRDRK